MFHQSQLEWSRHLGEEIQLDFGRWIANPEIDSEVANCLHDAFVLPNVSAVQLIEQMEEKSRQAGVIWRGCSINPSAPQARRDELATAFLQAGWNRQPLNVLHQRRGAKLTAVSDWGLTIIPTRASYRHFQQLLDRTDMTRASGSCELLHLDDSHLDSLLALREGKPVGCISILTSGEVGTLRQWFVPESEMIPPLGPLLLNRALEICTRAQLRHVMVGLQPGATVFTQIATDAGFESIGEWVHFARPDRTL